MATICKLTEIGIEQVMLSEGRKGEEGERGGESVCLI